MLKAQVPDGLARAMQPTHPLSSRLGLLGLEGKGCFGVGGGERRELGAWVALDSSLALPSDSSMALVKSLPLMNLVSSRKKE